MACSAGATAVSIAHALMQRPGYFISSPACPKGGPTVSMPKNGAWNGAPGRSAVLYTAPMDPPNPYAERDNDVHLDCSAYQPLPGQDNEGNASPNEAYGGDPYSFIMPDGPPGSPEDGTAAPVLWNLVGDTPDTVAAGPVPEFQAAVTPSVDLDVKVTPEARLGIQIRVGSSFGLTLVNKQMIGYGIYLLHNIGCGG
ncbi:hypothetical protein B0T26DRAFT_673439 [Lasiosphaeria miniovina]|uniref:Uncharacterized protein n=1 Tax=Lasiosphaeria miniovina TaxID=1954250 RepID=A0AA40DYX7_9PEZI|nr:uncharacterized protein B0T26DRAFT_673439 [Lasiosphaeria miniovina]KAK0721639.1 hypothetical protein B0T26DRAFT_673439 [Lasiosphaeria miniovina]